MTYKHRQLCESLLDQASASDGKSCNVGLTCCSLGGMDIVSKMLDPMVNAEGDKRTRHGSAWEANYILINKGS